MSQPAQMIAVRWLRPGKHLSRVLELEQEASASRTRIYGGTPWGVDQFREALKTGAGLVVESRDGTIAFAVYTLTPTAVVVAKLVAPDAQAESAILAALWNTVRDSKRSFLDLPLILEL